MKKILKYIILLIIIIPIYTNAETIDITKKGSINIHYKYNEETIEGSTISIYKIANYNTEGKLNYIDNIELDDSLEIDTASKWNDLALKINNYIEEHQIEKINNCEIKKDEECKFSNLDVGLYLITSTAITQGDYKYSSSPTLITLPNHNEIEDNYDYDIDLFLKVGTESIKPEKPNQIETTVVPKTIDNYYTFLIIFISSIVVMISVIIYINKLRKKEEKNEKNN